MKQDLNGTYVAAADYDRARADGVALARYAADRMKAAERAEITAADALAAVAVFARMTFGGEDA